MGHIMPCRSGGHGQRQRGALVQRTTQSSVEDVERWLEQVSALAAGADAGNVYRRLFLGILSNNLILPGGSNEGKGTGLLPDALLLLLLLLLLQRVHFSHHLQLLITLGTGHFRASP